MASWYMGVDRGFFEQPGKVTSGTTTASNDFEMRIDTGKSSTKEDVIKALEVFKQFVLSNGIQSGTAGGNLPPN